VRVRVCLKLAACTRAGLAGSARLGSEPSDDETQRQRFCDLTRLPTGPSPLARDPSMWRGRDSKLFTQYWMQLSIWKDVGDDDDDDDDDDGGGGRGAGVVVLLVAVVASGINNQIKCPQK
jgi:hypothetical protein